MGATRTCDHRGCPAHALHRVDLYGQDFHFCGHHWTELAPILEQQVAAEQVDNVRQARQRVADPELASVGSGPPG